MLEWNEIIGIDNNMSYCGNHRNGVVLPEENEEVLFYRSCFYDETKDMYFSGYITEGRYSLIIINSVTGGIINDLNGIKWARFNKPKTNNNVGYAIAYLDEYGNGYINNIPNIIDVLKNEIEQKIVELKNRNYSKITVFDYIKPCTYMYDWDYIDKNKINW